MLVTTPLATTARPLTTTANVACPTCGDTNLDIEATNIPTGARRAQAEATVAVGCSCCGFAAERRPDGLAVLDRGMREVGFDKHEYRRRLAALARLTPAVVLAERAPTARPAALVA